MGGKSTSKTRGTKSLAPLPLLPDSLGHRHHCGPEAETVCATSPDAMVFSGPVG